MICPGCSVDRIDKDFMGKERCYKCIYKEKLELCGKKGPKIKKCNICKGEIPHGRRSICSDKCSVQAMKNHNKTYWIRKIDVHPVEWN